MDGFKTAQVFLLAALTVAASDAQEKQSPVYGRYSADEFQKAKNCHGGPGSLIYQVLLKDENFQSNINFFSVGRLAPGSGIGEHIHRNTEEMFFIFNAPAEFTLNGHTSLLPARSCVLCPMGSSHGLYNSSDETLEWLDIAVTKKKGEFDAIDYGEDLTAQTLESPPHFKWARFDRSLLMPSGPAHQGKGAILYRRIWDIESKSSGWKRISHAILPPGSSIGYHQHNTDEEIYYIMDGTGRITVNDVTWDVAKGDAVPCRLGESHGFYNNSNDILEIFICRVASDRKGTDVVEFGDDLTYR